MSSIYQRILLLVFVNQMFITECDAGHLLVKAPTQTEVDVTDKKQTLQENIVLVQQENIELGECLVIYQKADIV